MADSKDTGKLPGSREVPADQAAPGCGDLGLRMMAELLDIAPSSITVHDFEGRFLYANRKTFEIHGYDEREFMALNLRDVDVPASAELIEARMRTVAAKGEASFEVEHLRKDGSVLPLEVFVKRFDCGAVPALLSVATDITEARRIDDLLKSERDNLSAIMAAAPVAILLFDEEERIARTNLTADRLFGRSPADPPSRRCGDFLGCVHRLDDPVGCGVGPHCGVCATFGAVRAALRDGAATRDLELTVDPEPGAEAGRRVFMVNVEPLSIDGKRHAVAALHEITAAKAAIVDLARGEARMRSLQDIARYPASSVQEMLDFTLHEAIRLTGSRIGYIYHYDEDRRIFTLNSWSREVMKECSIVEQQTEYELDKTGIWGEAVRQRRPIVINDFQAPDPLKKGYPEGHVTLRRYLTVPVFEGERIVAVVGVANKESSYDDADVLQLTLMMDTVWKIARQRETSDALRAAERQYAIIAQNTADVIAIMDLSLRFTYLSPSEHRLRGFTAEEAMSQSLDEMFTPASIEVIHRSFAEEMALEASGGADPDRVRIVELEQLCKDGSTVWIEACLSFLRDKEGRATGILSVARDLSSRRRAEEERKRLEEQLRVSQKMEAIGRLAGGVAHDFNNLLSVIMSYTGFAIEDLHEGDPIRDDLLQVHAAGERAAALTRQLLAFGRRQIMEPAVLDLNAVVGGMESMLARLLGEDIDLSVCLAASPVKVKADPGQIEQVIMNLAVNARDAMPEGGTLTLETASVEIDEAYAGSHVSVSPGRYVLLAITDSGCGMDEETRRRAFEPFFTTKGKEKGTGLGLATVYGIVKQSGGNIWVYSEPGRGTSVKVYLPACDEPSARRAQSSRPEQAIGDETVLVAEDEEAVRELTRRILASAGYRVLTAANAGEALLLCEQQGGAVDLLLTDVVMPKMSGKQLADRLGGICPRLKILFMSGYTDNAIVHHGALDPGTHFIGKPFSAAELTRKVREVLDGGKSGDR